ncbi:MAG: FAD-dependent oxidoreductase [Chloroflexi bacterium]|nr:FAD-dependent oxidoreductase [Chloroflexota bacterium]
MPASEGIVLYGAHWCPDCKRSKKFLGEQMVPYRWVDIEQDKEARHYVEKVNNGKRIIPTIVFPDGDILVEPSNADLAAKLGLQTKAKMDFYDLIIVGGGPAGLTAAIYTAREGLDTLIIEMGGLGGQASATERLDNYPGFPDGITGQEWAERVTTQARNYGVEILQAQEVSKIEVHDPYRYVFTGDGSCYSARTVLLATGADYKRLNAPGEEDYIGAGVHFCATCDGPFYKGQDLVVIGGGNSATEESLFLTKFSPHVTLLVRGGQLKASQVLIDKIMQKENIEVYFNTSVKDFHGEGGKLTGIRTVNTQTGTEETLTPAGVFVFIGQKPNSEFVADLVERDKWGFILTGHDLVHVPGVSRERRPMLLETSVPGIFAAGDVRAGSTKQVATAAGEGATAALMVREYLKEA